jgi:hypothetical protein
MPLKLRTATGLSIYALFQGTGGIAVESNEGFGLDIGWYTVHDGDIEGQGLPAGTYSGVFLEGSVLAPSASDPEHGTFSNFVWDGEQEVPPVSTDDIEDALHMGAVAAVVQRHPAIHHLGDLVKLSATFLDAETGLVLDPTVVKLSVKPPDPATTTTHIYGSSAIIKDSTGNYHYNQNANVAGNWFYRWWSTGNGQAAEEKKFKVIDAESQ